MNNVQLIGRLTKDADVRMAGETKVATFTLAVNRIKKGEADFIRCKAFGKVADLIESYVFKGHQIGIAGRIQTGSYVAKNGTTVYTTDVVVNELDFLEKKQNLKTDQYDDLTPVDDIDEYDDLTPMYDINESDIPF